MTVVLFVVDVVAVGIVSGFQAMTGRGRSHQWREVVRRDEVRRDITRTVFDTQRALLAELVWHARYQPRPATASTDQSADEAAS